MSEPGHSAARGVASISRPPAAIWLLFLGFFLAFQVIFRSQPFNDPGSLWHTRVGDLIFQSGFPHTDPFTWSHTGKFWIPQQWGGECLMSLAHRLGGFDAMLTLMNAMLAFMAAWIGKRFLDGGLHPFPAAGIIALGMASAGFHFYLRPHMATIVLMAVVMAWLVDFERRRIPLARLAWLIPLCIVWTNLHGGVLGGIFTVGLAIGGWALVRARSLKETGLLAAILLACLAATLVNPFGLGMHRTWFRIVGSAAMKEIVPEHFPLDLARTDGQAVVAFAVFYLFMLAGTLPKLPRITWIIPLVWLGLSVMSIRNGPLFIAAALITLADLVPETLWFRLVKKYGDTFVVAPVATPRALGWSAWAPIVAFVALAFGLQANMVPGPLIGYGWVRFDNKQVPIELTETLQEYAKSRPDGYPIFNDVNVGGFLIYYTPNLKIFMDDRFELYGDDGLRAYIDMVVNHPERIEEWRRQAHFDRALVEFNEAPEDKTALEKYLADEKNGWREVARCRKAILFERIN